MQANPTLDTRTAQLILVRRSITPGERRAIFRDAENARLIRVRPGVFLPTAIWRGLSPDEQYLARIAAAIANEPGRLVFSGFSAAALWRLPFLDAPPIRPEVISGTSNGGRSAGSLIRHNVALPASSVDFDCYSVTSLARTLVDIGRTQSFETGVCMSDFALRAPDRSNTGALLARVTKDELEEELVSLQPTNGHARARAVAAFAHGFSGSVGESVSRVGIHRLGFPAPKLQVSFFDEKGRMDVDFWFEEVRGIGEFDGHGKYLRDEFTHGRTAAQVVISEKDRENRLRAQNTTVSRWGWSEARSLPALRAKLLALGLRPERRARK